MNAFGPSDDSDIVNAKARIPTQPVCLDPLKPWVAGQ